MGGSKTFTVDGVLSAFHETTEYGITFRALSDDDRKLEVIRLNKGAASGMKGAIKKMRIDVQYKDLVSDKMKAFIESCRTEPVSMFRAVPRRACFKACKSTSCQWGSGSKYKEILVPGGIRRGGLAS